MKSFLFPCALFLALLLIPGLVPAQNTGLGARTVTYDPATIATADRSGRTGTSTDHIGGPNALLYGLTADERGDKPCYMEMHWWRKAGAGAVETFTTRFSILNCNATMPGDETAVIGNALSEFQAVDRLQVCNRDNNKARLKGLRMWSHSLADESDTGYASYYRTNCNRSQFDADPPPKSECQDNKRAVGLRFFHNADGIRGIALKCATIDVSAPPPVNPMNLQPATKVFTSNGQRAVVIFQYFGDSRFRTLFQEGQINLKKVVEAYDQSVILTHPDLPALFGGGNARALDLADEVLSPSFDNLAAALESLADAGYVIDLYIFAHGLPDEFGGTTGTLYQPEDITAVRIRELAQPNFSRTGYQQLPLRMVYQMNCYGSTLNADWQGIGAKTAMGSRFVVFNSNTFNRFSTRWLRGDPFQTAVDERDTATAWGIMRRLIVLDATSIMFAGKERTLDDGTTWKFRGCPLKRAKKVLGSHQCGRDYFMVRWAELASEWDSSVRSGREFMAHSSEALTVGDTTLTFNDFPTW